MDFLAPHANFTIDTRSGQFTSDANAIIHAAPADAALNLIAAGCVPLPPKGWADPRST
jgi:hypothetical protein